MSVWIVSHSDWCVFAMSVEEKSYAMWVTSWSWWWCLDVPAGVDVVHCFSFSLIGYVARHVCGVNL